MSERVSVSRPSDGRLLEFYALSVPLSGVKTPTPLSRETESSPVAEQRFAAADPAPVSQTVYDALADAEGVEPSDLDFVLYRSLDVDALDDLVRHGSASPSSWSVTFDVAEYEVTVESTGRIAVYEAT